MQASTWDSHVASPNNWCCRQSKALHLSMSMRLVILQRYATKSLLPVEHPLRHCIISRKQDSAPPSRARYGQPINGHWNWVRKSQGICMRRMKKRNEVRSTKTSPSFDSFTEL